LCIGFSLTTPPIEEIEKSLRELYREKTEAYKESVLAQELEWNDETKRNDPWKGIKQYKYAEYRLEDGTWVDEKEAKRKSEDLDISRSRCFLGPMRVLLTHRGIKRNPLIKAE